MIRIPDTIKVRPLSSARADYETSGARASTRYEEAVRSNTDQHAKSISENAERNYQAAMQKVLSTKRRQKMAAEKSSQSKWQQASASVGAPNLNAGISRSGGKWEEGFRPIAQALEGTTLPDRTTDPNQNIDQRLKKVVSVMRKAAGKE